MEQEQYEFEQNCQGEAEAEMLSQEPRCTRCNDNGCPACETDKIYHDGML